MFLKNRTNGEMLRVLSLDDLLNMNHSNIQGCYQRGEEEQDPENFNKADLIFLSGEDLPRCWTDPHYRDHHSKG